MGAALKIRERVSVEDYLAGELTSLVRHEYLGGDIYAMAGASEDHNVISLNIAAALHSHLRGKSCKAFMNDMKLKLWAQIQMFYYPDVMVICDPTDDDKYFKSKPTVIVEVVSESTRNTDEREKLITYMQIPSLNEYVLVEQEAFKVTVHRRSDDWMPEILMGQEAVMELHSLGFTMPLTQVYEGSAAGKTA